MKGPRSTAPLYGRASEVDDGGGAGIKEKLRCVGKATQLRPTAARSSLGEQVTVES